MHPSFATCNKGHQTSKAPRLVQAAQAELEQSEDTPAAIDPAPASEPANRNTMKGEKGLTPAGATPVPLNGKPPVPGKAEPAKADADGADDGPDKHVVPKKVSTWSGGAGMVASKQDDLHISSILISTRPAQHLTPKLPSAPQVQVGGSPMYTPGM